MTLTKPNPTNYYHHIVPQRFHLLTRTAPNHIVTQPPLLVTYEITGDGGGIYGLSAQGHEIEVIPGGILDSHMWTTMTIDDWTTDLDIGAADTIADYWSRGKAKVIQAIRGTLELTLTTSDDRAINATTVFGNQRDPRVVLRMEAADYAAMTRGELSSMVALLTGKLKSEGHFPLLLQLGALNP